MGTADDVVAHAVEVLDIAEVKALLAAGASHPFTEAELAYARDKSDPDRRLAARLAAKRAAARLLGGGAKPEEVEILRGAGGPPRLRLSGKARERLQSLGADRALVSLTHGREQAAASVLLLRGDMSLGRSLLRLGLLVVVAALLGAAYLSLAPIGDAAPHPFNHDRNAVWVAHRWLEKEHPPEETEALVSGLARRGIGYVYPHLIPFDASGRLPAHSREQMRNFLAVTRRVAPEMKVLPWVGGLRVGYKRTIQGTLDLADMGQRQRIVAECRGLVDEGFDGVHINVEPIADGNVDFLALLRAIRTAVGPNGIVSVSATRPGPISLPVARNFFWTTAYYERVAADADQVVVMAYDTALPTPVLYRRYVSYAAERVTSALVNSHARARVLVGIPSYDEHGLMHRAGVETLENGLLGTVAGLRGVGGGGTFEGVALYAEWTTGPEEWAVYERVWRGQDPPR